MSTLVATIAAYLAGINAATFAAFALDKRAAAAGTWRIRERTLLLLSAAGGSPAAFAARSMLRHKTVKQPFVGLLVAIAAIQAVLLGGLAWLAVA